MPMIRLGPLIKGIARASAWLIGVLVAVFVVWLAANRLLDTSPSPQQQAFSSALDNLVQDRLNVAVGILGLTAPEGYDFIQYGIEIKALYTGNASHAQIQEMIRGPKTLRPTVEGTQINCWLDPDWTSFKGCLPFEKAPAVLAENKELLERYETLYGLDHYSAPDIYYNDAYLVLTRLVIAEMQLDIRTGNYEAAYRKWRQQLHFVRSNLLGTDTWVGKAIGLVAAEMTLPVLDSLLIYDPDLARIHAAELTEILQPEGMSAFGPDGIVRAEFQLLRKAFDQPPVQLPEYGIDRLHWLAFHLGQKNRVLNRYAAFAPEYATAMRLHWSEMEKESARLREKYAFPSDSEFVLDPFGSLFLAQYIDGQLRAREILRQMHIFDGRLRLATLLVQLINKDIPDTDIAQFLAAADSRFFDPFTGSPARWDPKERKIYFLDPSDKCAIASWFRVRSAKGARKPSSSVVSTNAC